MHSDRFLEGRNNPPHWLNSDAVYMVTASTYEHGPIMRSPERKLQWQDAFQHAAKIHGWQIIAWVALDDHYHAMLVSPAQAENLSKFVASYHKFTARRWNREDGTLERKVWWNYWDTCVRSEDDYEARLRYIFYNPVKHGLAQNPEDYLFGSYREFLKRDPMFLVANGTELADVPEF
jgi:putative transposase